MASGGYRPPGNTTDFLEEWKAKREKMRARFAAATGANAAETGPSRNGAAPPAELNNNGGGERAAAAPPVPASAVAARSGAPAPKRLDEDGGGPAKSGESGARNSPADACDVEAESPPAAASSPPACIKNKDKMKSSGPSARKGKGQIEKRKLREKRRSTGVVNIPSTESPDDDDHSGQKPHQREDTITQQNTIQNESITSDASSPYNETPRTTNRWKSTTNAPEEDIAAYSTSNRYSGRAERPGYNRYGNTSSSSTFSSTLEKKLEEFEKDLVKERQENQKLVKLLQERDDLIGKLKEEIDLLNRDLDEIEDENDQLKQENKTLLKVVGQLTR
ncbi:PRKC apoptosis WT1 regulator protein [Scyliorhinus torazame]|uniref:PRKC apoptosis WT1 regulator protein n=1 Tax=Scyliorhinus torazame TaxID=75743 RepID=UPI003B5CCD0A